MQLSFKFSLLCFGLSLIFSTLQAQPSKEAQKAERAEQKKALFEAAEKHLAEIIREIPEAPKANAGIRIAFYNVENYFDTKDDSLKNDNEFLPDGVKAWNYKRYREKQNNIYRTFMAMGGWDGPPSLIGVCEIENRFVLEDLLRQTELKKFNYGVVHEESPDNRGIDVGLFYRKDHIRILKHQALPLIFPFDTAGKTRDILYVKALVLGKDTLHYFVNHWPSRWGGQAKSEPRRMEAAKVIRNKVDSIQNAYADAHIIIIGDLNDEYENRSIIEGLRAKTEVEALKPGDLFNYTRQVMAKTGMGSHKYQGHWGTLDHVIVSQSLLRGEQAGKLKASPQGAFIFTGRFLLEEDTRNTGFQPFRTYAGPKYLGGFSDHLPVFLDLLFTNP